VHDSILFLCIHEPHRDRLLHPVDDDSSDSDMDSENACIDPEQPLVCIHIYGTPHLENGLASKYSCNKDIDIIQDNSDVWSPFSCEEDDR